MFNLFKYNTDSAVFEHDNWGQGVQSHLPRIGKNYKKLWDFTLSEF